MNSNISLDIVRAVGFLLEKKGYAFTADIQSRVKSLTRNTVSVEDIYDGIQNKDVSKWLQQKSKA